MSESVKENLDDCKQMAVRKYDADREAELAGVMRALRRAQDNARKEARQFGHGIMIWRDGKVVEEGKDCPAND